MKNQKSNISNVINEGNELLENDLNQIIWMRLLQMVEIFITTQSNKIKNKYFKNIFVEEETGHCKFAYSEDLKEAYKKTDNFYAKINDISKDLIFKKNGNPWDFEIKYSDFLKLFNNFIKDFFKNKLYDFGLDRLSIQKKEILYQELNSKFLLFKKIIEDLLQKNIDILNDLFDANGDLDFSNPDFKRELKKFTNEIIEAREEIFNFIKFNQVLSFNTTEELDWRKELDDFCKKHVRDEGKKAPKEIIDKTLALSEYIFYFEKLRHYLEVLNIEIVFGNRLNDFKSILKIVEECFWELIWDNYQAWQFCSQAVREILKLEYDKSVGFKKEALNDVPELVISDLIDYFSYRDNEVSFDGIKGKYSIALSLGVVNKTFFDPKKYQWKDDYLVVFSIVNPDKSIFNLKIYNKNKKVIFQNNPK